MNKKLLIVLDVQNDFIQIKKLANKYAAIKLKNIICTIDAHEGITIAVHDTHFTEEQVKLFWPTTASGRVAYYESDEYKVKHKPEHCIKLSDGWDIQQDVLAALKSKNEDGLHQFYAIDKYGDSYHDWVTYLQDFTFDEIELCGFNASTSIVATAAALRALYPNLKIIVNPDCISDTQNKLFDEALQKLIELDVILIDNIENK